MNINSNDCNDKSNNILGYFGGIPQGRTYSKQPRDYCPSNPLNYIVGKCKVNPWFFFREVLKIPVRGVGLMPTDLSRMSVAMIFCFLHSSHVL